MCGCAAERDKNIPDVSFKKPMYNIGRKYEVEINGADYVIKGNVSMRIVNIDGQDYICLFNIYDKGGVSIIPHTPVSDKK
jgi:hypothetical protein